MQFTFLLFLLSMHTDLEPYLLFADGEYGAIYRSNINASGIQQLVRRLSRPIALDFDYRYNASYIYYLPTLDQSLLGLWTRGPVPYYIEGLISKRIRKRCSVFKCVTPTRLLLQYLLLHANHHTTIFFETLLEYFQARLHVLD